MDMITASCRQSDKKLWLAEPLVADTKSHGTTRMQLPLWFEHGDCSSDGQNSLKSEVTIEEERKGEASACCCQV